jgi:hypothetical protein
MHVSQQKEEQDPIHQKKSIPKEQWIYWWRWGMVVDDSCQVDKHHKYME